MALLSATVIVDGKILTCDVLEHDNGFWLVPEWIETKTEGWMSPIRMIGLGSIRHYRNSDGTFVVSDPIPKSVFDGAVQPKEASPYELVLFPDIRVPTRLERP